MRVWLFYYLRIGLFCFSLIGNFVHLVKTDRFNKETLNYFSGAMAVLVTMLTVSLF